MIEISVWKILLVMVVAVIVLGPEQLPRLARSIGKLFVQLRGAADSVQKELRAISFEENKPETKDKNEQE